MATVTGTEASPASELPVVASTGVPASGRGVFVSSPAQPRRLAPKATSARRPERLEFTRLFTHRA